MNLRRVESKCKQPDIIYEKRETAAHCGRDNFTQHSAGACEYEALGIETLCFH